MQATAFSEHFKIKREMQRISLFCLSLPLEGKVSKLLVLTDEV